MEVENYFGKPDDQGFHIKKPTKILTNDNQLRAQDRAFSHSSWSFLLEWSQQAKLTSGPGGFQGKHGTEGPALEWESQSLRELSSLRQITSAHSLPCENEKVALDTIWSRTDLSTF